MLSSDAVPTSDLSAQAQQWKQALCDAAAASCQWIDESGQARSVTAHAGQLQVVGQAELAGPGAGRLGQVVMDCGAQQLIWECLQMHHQAAAELTPSVAWRWRLVNNAAEPCRIGTAIPYQQSRFAQISPCPAGQWQLFRQPRHKNDMPTNWSTADHGPACWDAVSGMSESGGVPAAERHGRPSVVSSSELSVVALQDHAAVALAVLPCDEQLVDTRIRVNDKDQPTEIDVVLHGDGAEIAGKSAWASQWLVQVIAPEISDAAEIYAEFLRAHYPEAARRRDDQRALSVWCSWYFYGGGCKESQVSEDLDALAKQGIPIDVVQIDDCWDDRWGDWQPGSRWPGIASFARRVNERGYRAGIWTCAFLCEPRASLVFDQPAWLLRNAAGHPLRFGMNGSNNFILDPTHPGVVQYVEELYRRLTVDWGFSYHKIDFTRAVAHPDAVYHDPAFNRAQAYRCGLQAIRRGMGDAAYLNICGGLYGPSIGLADAQRTGSDVRAAWPDPPADQDPTQPFGPFTIKQNTLRWWMNRLWANDGDALMLRRRQEPFSLGHLSLGMLTDDEAITCTLNQYLAGGLVCVSERMAELDADRQELWRFCLPPVEVAARPLRMTEAERYPSLFVTEVSGRAAALGEWWTIAVVNWYQESRRFELDLHDLLHLDDQLRVGLFVSGRILTLDPGENLSCELRPHAAEVIRVQIARPQEAQLLLTDGNFSMGREIVAWEECDQELKVSVQWPWKTALHVHIQAPAGKCFADQSSQMVQTIQESGQLVIPFAQG